MPRNIPKFLFSLVFLTILADPAAAWPRGWLSDGPNCRPLADAPFENVWLGHFAGGRWILDPFGAKVIDWRDEHVCFASRASCELWQRRMSAAFNRIGGHRTCVRIR
jgi:hypothetical protein